MENRKEKSEYEIMQDVIIDGLIKENEELWKKYQIILNKLSNNSEIQKQTDEMIKFYNYMTSHDRLFGPVIGFIAGVVISIILFSIL